MYLTEKEIFNQYEALKETYRYLVDEKDEIVSFKESVSFSSITYIGSGSSYTLCQSAAVSTQLHLGMPAYALAAGDLMLNFEQYRNIIKDTLLVAPSRSGSTSEVVESIKKAKKEYNSPCIAISARKGSILGGLVDYSLELPWIFDESVCQTRTVTNLYTVNLFLIGAMAGDKNLLDEIANAVENGEDFLAKYTDKLTEIGSQGEWSKVVILADGELSGIAGEAAIAFKEIPQLMSNYYHVLDVRHGPMVLIDKDTLVIMAVSQGGLSYQQDLVDDIKEKGAKIITVGDQQEDEFSSDLHVQLPQYQYFGVVGIPFIFIPQVIAYNKALKLNINPDLPTGLDPWIEL